MSKLTPWIRVVLEKQIVLQLVKKFSSTLWNMKAPCNISFGVEWKRVHYKWDHDWPFVPASDGVWWWVWSSQWNVWQGKLEYLKKTCPSDALSTTNPTSDRGSNPGHRSDWPLELLHGLVTFHNMLFFQWWRICNFPYVVQVGGLPHVSCCSLLVQYTCSYCLCVCLEAASPHQELEGEPWYIDKEHT
jgi:hypothetical protein